jgi:hypothetical protein
MWLSLSVICLQELLSYKQEWETVIAKGICANLTQTLNINIWLRDFYIVIKVIAESFAIVYKLKLFKGIGLTF